MGQWTIVISGTGVHHNQATPQDANRMALGFVNALKLAGHSVVEARFTHGGSDNLQGLEHYEPTTMIAVLSENAPVVEARSKGYEEGYAEAVKDAEARAKTPGNVGA